MGWQHNLRRTMSRRNVRRLREVLLADDTVLNAEVKKRWLKALRSGKYKQGRDTMCWLDNDGSYSFCCLGVLGDQCIDTDWHRGLGGNHRLGPCGSVDVLSTSQMKLVGLSSAVQDALTRANDDGLRFTTIASAIEECL